MNNKFLFAQKRNITGTGNSRKIRKQNLLPANIIFLKKQKNTPIQLQYKETFNIIKNLNYKQNLQIFLKLNKKEILVKIKEIQMHPYKHEILHIDFIH